MIEVVIVSAARLAVGRLGGALRDAHEEAMGAAVIKEAITRAEIEPSEIDEVIFGQNYRTGRTATNIARPLAIKAGIPIEVPEITINMHCAAGLKSVILASQVIKAGDADTMIAGGIDLMSRAAYLLPDMRWGSKFGHKVAQDQLVMLDPVVNMTTGQTAEKLAKQFNISREEQDEFALWSQQKTEAAIKEGRFKEEILPFEIAKKAGLPVYFDIDEHPRFGTTRESLAKLPPAFVEGGSVTAGNSSGLNDGAAALVVMSLDKARQMGLKPLAKIRGYSSVGVDPSIMGIAPVPATKNALKSAGLQLDDIDLIELNEAFACMSVYFQREMAPKPEKLNVNGGAIALGHPIAATGAVILTKLLYEMKRRGLELGLATMCVGGGQGAALIVDANV